MRKNLLFIFFVGLLFGEFSFGFSISCQPASNPRGLLIFEYSERPYGQILWSINENSSTPTYGFLNGDNRPRGRVKFELTGPIGTGRFRFTVFDDNRSERFIINAVTTADAYDRMKDTCSGTIEVRKENHQPYVEQRCSCNDR